MPSGRGNYACEGCTRCNSSKLGAARKNATRKVAAVGTLGVSTLTTATCGRCGHPQKDHRAAATAYAPAQYVPQPVVHVVEVPAQQQGTPAGWYPDPTGRHEQRWWGGASWMDAVVDGTIQGSDPEGVRLMDQPAESAQQTARTMAEQLRDLAQLRNDGILTDAEFEAQKARLLG